MRWLCGLACPILEKYNVELYIIIMHNSLSCGVATVKTALNGPVPTDVEAAIVMSYIL